MSTFKKATKKQAKLRLTFDGPAGSGKTYSSLVLAKALGGRTALIDSEHASASKYADLFDFDTVALEDHSPLTYIKFMKEAAKEGYDNVIVDSLTHAWTGKGGALEIVDRENDKFGKGWRKVTPMHNQLVDTILTLPCHIITTLRTKMEYVQEKDANGRTTIKKMGMAPVQREGMEYEFDVVADLTIDGNLNISKSRCPALKHRLFDHSNVEEMGKILAGWLSDGEVVEMTRSLDEHLGVQAISPSINDLLESIRHAPNKDALMAIYNEQVRPAGLEKIEDIVASLKARKAELSEG